MHGAVDLGEVDPGISLLRVLLDESFPSGREATAVAAVGGHVLDEPGMVFGEGVS